MANSWTNHISNPSIPLRIRCFSRHVLSSGFKSLICDVPACDCREWRRPANGVKVCLRWQFCVCGSWMYWTDWEEDEVNDSIGRIEKAWMDGSNRRIFVTSNMLWPNGLTLDHSTSTMFWCDAYYDHIERIYLNGTGRMVSVAEIQQVYPFTGFSCDTWMLFWFWDSVTRSINTPFTSINKVRRGDFCLHILLKIQITAHFSFTNSVSLTLTE